MHVANYFKQVSEISAKIDTKTIDKMAEGLDKLRERQGRLFILGVGGSAANASHAVNDFRKLCNIEAYAPTDNVSELTARTNDDGWESIFANWFKVSRANSNDAVLVLSVGGGNAEKNVSVNLVRALQTAKEIGMNIFGIVGRDGGFTATVGEAVVIIPTVDDKHITPHTEAFQAVVWHCLVSHPVLQTHKTKW